MFIINPYAFGVASLSSYLAVAHNIVSTRGITAYPFTAAGFGVKVADPGGAEANLNGKGVAFSKNGALIAMGSDTSPYIKVWPWTGTFGTKYANPASIPAGQVNGIAFTSAVDAIALGHSASPFLSAYTWSGSGFGAKVANPAALIGGQGNKVAFSPTDDALAVAHSASVAPFVSAYQWSGAGFGAKYANPAASPAPPRVQYAGH